MIERKNNTTMYTSDAFVGVKEKRNVSNGTEYSANIVIFNQSASSTIFSSMKLYYFRIYDNNQLIRYFIPCYRVSDNEVGLYDLVNDEFYSNKGTGTFIKGNDI